MSELEKQLTANESRGGSLRSDACDTQFSAPDATSSRTHEVAQGSWPQQREPQCGARKSSPQHGLGGRPESAPQYGAQHDSPNMSRDVWPVGSADSKHWVPSARETPYGMPTGCQRPRRHGPGLKGLWQGDDVCSPPKPHRQGPGLRGLWSGQDTAATDAARDDAKASFQRALDRDDQQRRAALSGQSHGGLEKDLYGADGYQVAALKLSTSPNTHTSGGSGQVLVGDDQEARLRLEAKAKQAVYAEALRCQIAEKEAHKAGELARATMADSQRGTSLKGTVQAIARGPESSGGAQADLPQSRGRVDALPWVRAQADETFSHLSCAGDDVTVPDSSSSHHHEGRRATLGDSTPATAARQRLVQDVYGGNGMGAALQGAGYGGRRASTGSRAMPGDTLSGVLGIDELGRSQNTSPDGHPLRTRIGVHDMQEASQEDVRAQKRTAALEHQRFLQEQIAAKRLARKEAEEQRRREDEEEGRWVRRCDVSPCRYSHWHGHIHTTV